MSTETIVIVVMVAPLVVFAVGHIGMCIRLIGDVISGG